jgi:hypothetical protein
MPATSIQSPFPIFTDIDGQPLEQGQVWLGTAGNNPISSPITAYWDAALTQVVTQPVTTRGGYPLNGTAVGRLYVNADFSILVRNRRGYDVLSALSATERFDSSLVTFVQAGAGAVVRTAQAKMRDVVSVKNFGAVGDGVADDTVAFQNALAASKFVTIPKGSYIISSTLYFSNHEITGESDTFPGGVLITMTGNAPAFQYNGAYEYGTKISGIFIDYGDLIPASGATKIGINIPNVAAWPAFYEFSDIRIRGAHIGINDAGAAWHGRYTRVWTEKCRIGFFKLAGTDMVWEQCYAQSGYQAWDIENTIGAVLTACAFDNNTDPDAVPIFRATNVTGLVINGMDQETNVITANGNAMMKIAFCNGFLISGIGIVDNKISPATGENYWMYITNTSVGEVVGCNTATLAYDKSGGGTTVYIISVGDTASVAIKGCNLAEIIRTTTPSATRSVGNSGTGKVTLEATRTTDATSNVYQVVSALNGVVSQSSFNTATSTTLALIAGTPVNVVSCAGEGAYLVSVYANNGNDTIYQSAALVINDGSLATITSLKAGANLTLTLAGTTVQANCSGTTTGSYQMLRLL